MPKNLALLFLALASPALLVTSISGSRPGEILYALLAVAFPIALIVLGASGKRGVLGPLGFPLLGLLLFYEACVVAMIALAGQVPEGPWLGGLPLAAAIQLYGFFLAPLPVVSYLYARTFDRFGLKEEDLEQLRRRFANGEDESGRG